MTQRVRPVCPKGQAWMLRSDDRYWFRCTEPERPADAWVTYVWACDSCFLALTVDARLHPDQLTDNWDDEDSIESTLAATLLEAISYRHRLGLPAIRLTYNTRRDP